MKYIALRQLAVKQIDEESVFSKARKLLLSYELPTAYELMNNPPSIDKWKDLLKNAMNNRDER